MLRPLLASDYSALCAFARDPLAWADHPASDRWQEPEFAAYFAGLLDSGGSLVAIDKASGEPVAVSRYQYGSDENGGTIEIGSTLIARSHWGTYVNREMKRLMIEYALRHVARVTFWAWAENVRSRRALEKIGARPTGQVEEVEMNGRMVPHVVYEMTRADFAAGPLSPSGSASA